MNRLLLLLPLLLGTQSIAGDLGPADLSAEQISAGFPSVGTTWKAWCGTWKNERVDCSVELGENELIVDGTFQVSYESITRSEKWDSMMAITRLAKLDPVWAGWKSYRRAQHISQLGNTVLIEYRTTEGDLQAALFTFPENRVSDWYGFGNAMRLISYGGRPKKPMDE